MKAATTDLLQLDKETQIMPVQGTGIGTPPTHPIPRHSLHVPQLSPHWGEPRTDLP
jgi:hypothetical protein